MFHFFEVEVVVVVVLEVVGAEFVGVFVEFGELGGGVGEDVAEDEVEFFDVLLALGGDFELLEGGLADFDGFDLLGEENFVKTFPVLLR